MTDSRYRGSRIRTVESASNALVKIFRRALAEGVTREGWLAVEGPLLLEEALKTSAGTPAEGRALRTVRDRGSTIHSVVVSRNGTEKLSALLDRLPSEAEVVQLPDRLFQQIARTESPQGVAALVELRPPHLDSVFATPEAVLLVACGLQDPGNLGTIMRSAQAFGATALITLTATVSPFNPKTVRSSAGAVFRLPILRNFDTDLLFERLSAAGIRAIAADRYSSTSLAGADLRGPVAFLIGREATGLEAAISQRADLRLSIPIQPDTDSMNAASAASIFLYEAARQRRFRY